MANLSDYAEKALLDHVNGTAAFTMPANTFVKMHIGVTGDDGTTNAAATTTRMNVDFAAATLGTGTTSNSAIVEWLSVATAETWTHFSIWDAATLGNCLWANCALTTPVALTVGMDARFAVGALTTTLA